MTEPHSRIGSNFRLGPEIGLQEICLILHFWDIKYDQAMSAWKVDGPAYLWKSSQTLNSQWHCRAPPLHLMEEEVNCVQWNFLNDPWERGDPNCLEGLSLVHSCSALIYPWSAFRGLVKVNKRIAWLHLTDFGEWHPIITTDNQQNSATYIMVHKVVN